MNVPKKAGTLLWPAACWWALISRLVAPTGSRLEFTILIATLAGRAGGASGSVVAVKTAPCPPDPSLCVRTKWRRARSGSVGRERRDVAASFLAAYAA